MALPLKLHCRQWLALWRPMVARLVLLLLTPLPLPMLPLKLHCRQWLAEGQL